MAFPFTSALCLSTHTHSHTQITDPLWESINVVSTFLLAQLCCFNLLFCFYQCYFSPLIPFICLLLQVYPCCYNENITLFLDLPTQHDADQPATNVLMYRASSVRAPSGELKVRTLIPAGHPIVFVEANAIPL